MYMKKALITGIAGQDGFYLTELLLKKGYSVSGLDIRNDPEHLSRLGELAEKVEVFKGDMRSQESIDGIIQKVLPDEVYNFAAQSFVPKSWEDPATSSDVTGLGVARLLSALARFKPEARFCQASSAIMFGTPMESLQDEQTPFNPKNPYGAAKAFAHFLVTNYREGKKMFACSAILYNHESPKRGIEFVTKKITRAAAMIKLGLAKELKIGNMDAKRDWGFAGDYVEAMWLMLQQEKPDDYVVATGQSHSVREFIDLAFKCVGLDPNKYLVKDPVLLRPNEVTLLVGSPEKAKKVLNWKPKVSFDQLVGMMVDEDIKDLQHKKTELIA